jgi:hypothetical protein
VLCGLEVPPAERQLLHTTLSRIGFDFREVTDSNAVAFLSGDDQLPV